MIEIDCDFPGGNVIVEGIEGDTIRLAPDQRDIDPNTHWFYWYYRVRGAQGRTLNFVFERADVGVRGPAVSLDRGWTWRWLGAEHGDDHSFVYGFATEAGEVRLSFGMPYTQHNWDAFVADRAGNPHLRLDTLCRSRKGRAVEYVSFGRIDAAADHRVLITARHHCCEMMASYVLEGLIVGALTDDEAGHWLRDHVEFLAVPFMDKDGVEEGDQGKRRLPHDHNRDYTEAIYPEVRRLKTLVHAWSDGRLRFALDLHCPWIRGLHNEEIYFVGVPEADAWARTEAFAAVLERVHTGPLPYRRSDNLPFGQDWNTGDGSPKGEPATFERWASIVPGVWFGSTIEFPYANVHGVEVTPASARAFGRDLAAAISHYLQESR